MTATRWLACVLAIGCCTGRPAGADPASPATSQQAQVTRAKLDALRKRIHAIERAQRETATQKNSAAAALRKAELSIAVAAKSLRALNAQRDAAEARLQQLQARRDTLDAGLKTQRDALAALLRSAYALGGDEPLKLLLGHDDIATLGRTLTYYRYFQRAQLDRIGALLKQLDALSRVQDDIAAQNSELERVRAERTARLQVLQSERDARSRVLAGLDAKLSDQRRRMAALAKDEQGLVDLLRRLQDVFADIPERPAGAESFASQHGHLPWPLRGKLAAAFGSREIGGGDSRGLLIAAPEGSDVHAVAHGRVVYADWLRGYGLLLILDHGDGYLSLYGYNETLLKDVGDWVDAGEVIATSGDSGGRKTPGLYFELRHRRVAIDPRGWLSPSS